MLDHRSPSPGGRAFKRRCVHRIRVNGRGREIHVRLGTRLPLHDPNSVMATSCLVFHRWSRCSRIRVYLLTCIHLGTVRGLERLGALGCLAQIH